MSWLSDTLGRAESLLNQLDQSAAVVLSKPNTSDAHSQQLLESVVVRNDQSVSQRGSSLAGDGGGAAQIYTPPAQPATPSHVPRVSGYASSVASYLSAPVTKKPHDEDLMAYLNKPPKKETLSRQSSTSSLQSPSVMQHPLALAKNTDQNFGTVPEKDKDSGAYTFTTQDERRLGELVAREHDLSKALQAKDSQLAVLRVRLQESDQLLQQKNNTCDTLRAERDRLARASSEASAGKSEALDSLQERTHALEAQLDTERHSAKKTESDYLKRINRLEEESASTAGELTKVQTDLTNEQLRARDTADQLRLAKYNLEANKMEFDEYKQKAQKILATKESIIERLKSGVPAGAESETTSLAVRLEESRGEAALLREELQQAHVSLYNARSELQDAEAQLAGEQRQALEQQRSLQERCQRYQADAASYREQLEQMKQDYQYTQDELRRQQLVMQTKLQEKDAEIARLMGQGPGLPSDERVRQLTESLIHKQTEIEGLQTEKHSLSLQLERVRTMYEEAEAAAMRGAATAGVYGDDASGSGGLVLGAGGAHARFLPSFMRESTYDSGFVRGVKRTYGTLDALSIKIGLFLRRYPIARIVAIFYVLLLHSWVMVVLLTYTPEIHTAGWPPSITAPAASAAAANSEVGPVPRDSGPARMPPLPGQ